MSLWTQNEHVVRRRTRNYVRAAMVAISSYALQREALIALPTSTIGERHRAAHSDDFDVHKSKDQISIAGSATVVDKLRYTYVLRVQYSLTCR